ncbi:MAG: hypothetical protein ACUVRS_00875 [Armatimonadota bacterium]
MNNRNSRDELVWVLVCAVMAVAASSVPYIWGVLETPSGYTFLGFTHNIDDGAVYLSWMRQIADGKLTYINMFTNESVKARQFNLLFLIMGTFARVTHIQVIWVYHIFRAVLGLSVVLMVWQFSKLVLRSSEERKWVAIFVCFSSGAGWLFTEYGAPSGPVDNWQPEAITFLSIYLNPLFLSGIVLMLLSLYFLVLAHRTNRLLYSLAAGLFMLLLGNVHTYDLLTVAVVWLGYVFVMALLERRIPCRAILNSVIAGMFAIPSVYYQFHLYKIDEVFRARVNSPAPSPPIWSFLAGYGLVLMLAICGVVTVIQKRDRNMILPAVWSVVGFAVPYIPVAQQRKLIMGLHIPLSMMCVYALSCGLQKVPQIVRWVIICTVLLFSVNSNFAFLARDIFLLGCGRTVTHYVPHMTHSEMAAMRWLAQNGAWQDTVFAPPTFALFVPALGRHRVYYGHWSETPDYPGKISEWIAFADEYASQDLRIAILRRTRACYFVSTPEANFEPEGRLARMMRPVFSEGNVVIYELNLPDEEN